MRPGPPAWSQPSISLCRLWFVCASLPFAGCTYDVTLGSVKYALPAMSCGTWNSAGVRTTGGYFVGHSTDEPDDTLSYFVFDLSPIRGRKVTTAGLTIPGTSDWKFTVSAPGETPPLQFMLGVRPLPPSLTLTQVTDGSNDAHVFEDVQAEGDLGFAWDASGSITNTYGAFSYGTERFQDAVNAGGPYPMFAVQDYASTTTTEEYVFGGAVCNPGIVLSVTVE